MKTEEIMIDKSNWGAGPWMDEPDRKEWKDPETGLPCLAIRQPRLGHWCGYVAVLPGHKFHGVAYDSCPLDNNCPEKKHGNYCSHTPNAVLNTHGGITYSDKCSGHICHVPESGEPDDVFWFGFDCAHSGDLVPNINGMRAPGGILHGIHGGVDMGETYKSLSYVETECAELAKQLAAQT